MIKLATKFIEWKSKDGLEWEIMRWIYNYNVHRVYRYFNNQEGIVSKDEVL